MRSQTVDAARELAGWSQQLFLCCSDQLNGTVAITPQYTRSFHSYQLASCLFGSDCFTNTCLKKTITVSGSQVPGRLATDWLADYAGLPTDFQSTITFNPVVDSFLFDINAYLGRDCWYPGLFFKIQAPIVNLRTSLKFSEKVTSPGVNNYAAGYFGPNPVVRSNLLTTFTDFIGDSQTPEIDPLNGVNFLPLCAGKLGVPCIERLEETRLSDIEVVLGWNFLLEPDYCLGAGMVVRGPTGTHVRGTFLFEPQIGNGHHWELGAFIPAQWTCWNNESTDRSLTFTFEAYLTHLFSAHQCRTFDLKNNGCSSKYMLAELLATPVGPFLFGNGSNNPGGPTAGTFQPEVQFQNIYSPVANLTHIPVIVSNAIQADIALMLSYQHCSLCYDFGYDFWAKSRNKIRVCNTTALSSQQWALKGDAFTYGFGASNAIIGTQANIALSATESLATIHAGTNTPAGTQFTSAQQQNPGIDNPQFGVTSRVIADATDYINYVPGATALAANQQRTSLAPILLTAADIDVDKERVSAYSNKFFTHISYTWPDEYFWNAYIGLGGFIEQAHTKAKKIKNCPSAGKPCNCAVSQWAIWIKGGLSF